MNSSTFWHGVGCGSGSTKVTLVFGEEMETPEDMSSCKQLEKIFGKKPLPVQIDYHSRWMSSDEINKKYNGVYYEDTENHGFMCVIDILKTEKDVADQKDIKGYIWYECFISTNHRTPQTMQMSDIYASTCPVWTTDKKDKKSIVIVPCFKRSCDMYTPYCNYDDMESTFKLRPELLCSRYTQQETSTHKKIKR